MIAGLLEFVEIGAVGLLLHTPAAEALDPHEGHRDLAFHLGKKRARVAGEGPAAVPAIAHAHVGIELLLRIIKIDGRRLGVFNGSHGRQ